MRIKTLLISLLLLTVFSGCSWLPKQIVYKNVTLPVPDEVKPLDIHYTNKSDGTVSIKGDHFYNDIIKGLAERRSLAEEGRNTILRNNEKSKKNN